MTNDTRVLIIESDDALRAILFTILRHQPLGVDTAVSASAALEKVRICDYSLILIDANLPDDECRYFLSQFREERPEATTFILAVRDPRQDVFFEPQHVSAVLNKPLEVDTLAEIVRECALVVPPPEEPLPCAPAESDVRAQMERGSYYTN
jgi:DNA-binding response OmpR family regulator